MRSLFVKIFLWFWLTITLVGAILVIIALTTDHQAAAKARYVTRFTPYGNRLISIYEQSGKEALLQETRRIREKEGVRLVLFHEDTGPITMLPLPSRSPQFFDKEKKDRPRRPDDGAGRSAGRRENQVDIPLDRGYRLYVNVPPPTRIQQLLDPRALTLRLAVTFLVAGIVCYILARSLTAPIAKLRKAARELADGNLDTRVAHSLGSRQDEIAGLAEDFDQMAARIELLLQSQQQLLRDISHELRSPLARLNVALELARQPAGPEAQAPLDRIEKESERLNELIGQLLVLTQLESRAESLAKEPVALQDFLETIVRDANYEAQSHNRGVSLRKNSSEPVTVYGSPELLHRALENVIRNGLRYTAEGTEVVVSLDTGQGEARIAVRDHGPGVPAAALTELFRPFYRVAEARDRQSGGTGVGLAIAQQSIRLHNGRISAANHPDGGLLVTISLPVSAST